jgi:hypothetical protein
MAAIGDPVACEALCFVQNQFAKLARSVLATVMIDFYTYDEVLAPKKLVYDFAASASAPNCPAYIEHKGNNRLKACVDYLLTVYALLDVYKTKMPQYVTANLLHLPVFGNSSTTDAPALSTPVNELREQVAALSSKLEAFLVRGGGAVARPPPPSDNDATSGFQTSTSVSSVVTGLSSARIVQSTDFNVCHIRIESVYKAVGRTKYLLELGLQKNFWF